MTRPKLAKCRFVAPTYLLRRDITGRRPLEHDLSPLALALLPWPGTKT